MSERKLNWRQACTVLDCGKDKFYRLIRMGYLPATRVGKRGVQVKESDVVALLEPVPPDANASKNEENNEGFVR